MKLNVIMLIMILLVLTGCTSFRGIKPIYPDVGNPNSPEKVDSLQPTFRWEPSPGSDVSYDFIVFEGIKIESFLEGIKRSVGKEIYYRQGIKKPEHTIEVPLKKGAEYYWSVRTRQDGKVSEWTNYDYTLFLGTAYMWAKNRPFIFKTPE